MPNPKFQKLLDPFDAQLKSYQEIYKYLHANPELSDCEKETAAYIADHLRTLEVFEVHTDIGGHGLAATFKNGKGKHLMMRSELDALPVLENTGVLYASTKKGIDANGKEQDVMHACAHDMHMTCLLAAAKLIVQAKDEWSGTLTLVFQPAEERGTGAKAMVDGGLYDKVPVPDLVVGQHILPFKSGTLGSRRGVIMTACDSFKVKVYGRGAHGSTPHVSIDPVLMASNIVNRLQSIVSREIDTNDDMAVVTVGYIRAGFVENIIPDSAEIGVDIRTINTTTRDKIVASIKRKVQAEALSAGVERQPDITQTRYFPLTSSDPEETEYLESAFQEHFGDSFNPDTPRVPMSEDVSILASSQNKPCVFWHLGGIDPDIWEKCQKEGTTFEKIPINHSDKFAPVIMPTMKTGVHALAVAAFAFFGR